MGDIEKVQRLAVISEILNTEQAFVDDLGEVRVGYIERVEEEGMLDAETGKSIFGNLREIEQIHQELLDALKDRLGIGMLAPQRNRGGGAARGNVNMNATVRTASHAVGDIFLAFSGHFTAYEQYCASFAQSVSAIKRVRAKHRQFDELCQLQEAETGATLRDYLVKPIQRICRYPLLFGELLKRTPTGHPDRDVIEQSRAKLVDVATHVNMSREDAENVEAMMRIEKGLTGLKERVVQPSRRFVFEGDLMKQMPHKVDKVQLRHCFLFSDLIVFARLAGKKYAAKGSVDLRMALVRESPERGGRRFGFQLVSVDTKRIFTLFAESERAKRQWLTMLNQVIEPWVELEVRKSAETEKKSRSRRGGKPAIAGTAPRVAGGGSKKRHTPGGAQRKPSGATEPRKPPQPPPTSSRSASLSSMSLTDQSEQPAGDMGVPKSPPTSPRAMSMSPENLRMQLVKERELREAAEREVATLRQKLAELQDRLEKAEAGGSGSQKKGRPGVVAPPLPARDAESEKRERLLNARNLLAAKVQGATEPVEPTLPPRTVSEPTLPPRAASDPSCEASDPSREADYPPLPRRESSPPADDAEDSDDSDAEDDNKLAEFYSKKYRRSKRLTTQVPRDITALAAMAAASADEAQIGHTSEVNLFQYLTAVKSASIDDDDDDDTVEKADPTSLILSYFL